MIRERFKIENRNLLDGKKEPFDVLGKIVYLRTYARETSNDRTESWKDCVYRIVEGNLSYKKDYLIKNGFKWNENSNQDLANRLVKAIFDLKMVPGGRGLAFSGTEFVYNKGGLPLYNCAAVSVKSSGLINALCNAMMFCMNGCGVGYDTELNTFTDRFTGRLNKKKLKYEIEDSREGWVDSVRNLMESYLINSYNIFQDVSPVFDYSKIRKKGEKLKSSGGIASGLCFYYLLFK